MGCNPALSNGGSGSCPLDMGETVKFVLTSYKKEDGTTNKILLTDAAAKANWQTLIDKYNFDDDVLEKIVFTDRIFGVKQVPSEDAVFNENGFYKKLADGDIQFTGTFYDKVADYIKKISENSDLKLAIYLFDDKNQAGGRKDATYLVPLEVQSMAVTKFSIPDRETPSMATVTFQIANPKDMNDFWLVEVADGNIFDETDFWSLTDADITISSPATTGCVAVIDTERYDDAVTGAAYTAFNFYDAIAPTIAIPVAAAEDLVESPDGTYTISKTALLTTAHTYTLKVSYSKYDVATGSVVVP